MKKNKFLVFASIIFAAVLCGAAVIFLPALLSWIVCGAVIIACVWFAVYFCTLKYRVADNVLYITGGIIFRRTHILPLERILWRTRVLAPLGSRAILTVLHTAGGAAVIFSEPPN